MVSKNTGEKVHHGIFFFFFKKKKKTYIYIFYKEIKSFKTNNISIK